MPSRYAPETVKTRVGRSRVAWAASGLSSVASSASASATDVLIRSASKRVVVDREAPVHHHRNPCALEPLGRRIVANPDLHPDEARADGEEVIQQRGHVLRAPEDVDDVDRTGGGGGPEVGLHGLPENVASRRPDRDDGVAGPLQVAR